MLVMMMRRTTTPNPMKTVTMVGITDPYNRNSVKPAVLRVAGIVPWLWTVRAAEHLGSAMVYKLSA
jgi:hypothetical protein